MHWRGRDCLVIIGPRLGGLCGGSCLAFDGGPADGCVGLVSVMVEMVTVHR